MNDAKDNLIEKLKELIKWLVDKVPSEKRGQVMLRKLKKIAAFEKQIEEQESKPENEHDLIFKQDAIIKKQDAFLSYLLKYCGTSQRIRQYQFEINELKTK